MQPVDVDQGDGQPVGPLLLGYLVIALMIVWPIPYLPLSALLIAVLLPVWLPGVRLSSVRLLVLGWLCLPVWLLARTAIAGAPLTEWPFYAAQAAAFALFFGFFVWWFNQRTGKEIATAMLAMGGVWFVAVLIFFVPEPGYSFWKYGLASPAAFITVALATIGLQRGLGVVTFALPVGMGVALMLTDFRALGAILLVTPLLTLGITTARRLTARSAVAPLVVAGLGIYGLGQITARGGFGAEAQSKWLDQGGSLPAILHSGRPETGFALRAALEQPVFGFGALPGLPDDVIGEAAHWLPPMTDGDKLNVLERIAFTQINVHSVVMDWWLAAGILGLVLTVAVVVRAVHVIVKPRRGLAELQLLRVFAALSLGWDFLFSPGTYFSVPIWGVLAAILYCPDIRRSGNNGRSRATSEPVPTAQHRHDQPRQRVRS